MFGDRKKAGLCVIILNERLVCVAAAVTFCASIFWVYGYVGSTEPFTTFRPVEALIALSCPPALVVSFVFWSVDLARKVFVRGWSPMWLATVVATGAPVIWMSWVVMYEYCTNMSSFDCGR